MTPDKDTTKNNSYAEDEVYPVEPRYHPLHRFTRIIYDFLASAKLALALLVIILICCLLGVTVWRGIDSWQMIFHTLWFNSLLVLLVVNIACCFFGRIWGRRVTLISFGMILFHLSFVVMLLAIVYNGLFYFRGTIRLTEGESVLSGERNNYDLVDNGRFFSYSRLRGDTTLIKMHTGYKVGEEDKRAAYEIAVGNGQNRTQGIIYITHKLTHQGVDYFNEKEGYSLQLTLSDKQGNDLYGVFVPLQSQTVAKGSYKYFTGRVENGVFRRDPMPFPFPPEQIRYAVQLEYFQSKRVEDRSGEVAYTVFGLDKEGKPDLSKPLVEGKSPIGKPFAVGDQFITAKEVRFWVGMMVRYEPGKPVILTCLWVALAGMILTTVGRMLRGR